MVRSPMLATFVLAVVASLVEARTSPAAESFVPVPGAVSPQLAGADLEGAAEPEDSLPMSLTLRLRHRDELEALLAAQQEPTSPEFHRWLSPEEFATRFGPRAGTYATLVAWLREQGFTVRTWRNRSRVDFVGAVGKVETAFGVRMNRYRHRGRRALANVNAPRLPARFAPIVQAVRLNTLSMAAPVVRISGANGSVVAMGPRDLHAIYNVTPVLDGGIDGTGQTIAVVARSDFDDSDVTLFQQIFDLTIRAPTKAFPGKNPGVGSLRFACAGIRSPQEREACVFGEEAEVLLDVEFATGMAPGASILVDISDSDIDVSLADISTINPTPRSSASASPCASAPTRRWFKSCSRFTRRPPRKARRCWSPRGTPAPTAAATAAIRV